MIKIQGYELFPLPRGKGKDKYGFRRLIKKQGKENIVTKMKEEGGGAIGRKGRNILPC